MAETWVKDGSMRGWSVNVPVLPSGTDVTYQGVSIDVFPSWEAAMKGPAVENTFKKVHPGKNIDAMFETLTKSRDLGRRELMVVEEKAALKMRTSQ